MVTNANANDDREQAMEKTRLGMAAFIQRHRERDTAAQFDIDVMHRARVLDATMAGKVLFEIELGYEYSNSQGSLRLTRISDSRADLLLRRPSLDRKLARCSIRTDLCLHAPAANDDGGKGAVCQAHGDLNPTLDADLTSRTGPPGGVTRALNVTCLRPLPLPTTFRVLCEIVQHGRSLSLARGSIQSVDGQKIYATCEHHKAKPPPPQAAAAGGAKL
ncbi:hypothetical protein MMC19_005081 [Ptychographa xylographoides]|nr:hypothetical protein [Ptychographa xylographoides]